MYNKTCAVCGKAFYTKHKATLTCSNDCRGAMMNARALSKTKRVCRTCKRELSADSFYSYKRRRFKRYDHICKGCRLVQTRNRVRISNKKYGTPTDPAKQHARNLFQAAVRRGNITKLPCEVCGNPKSEGHHEDYSKPFEVRWLCRKHHGEAHRAPVDPACVEAAQNKGLIYE